MRAACMAPLLAGEWEDHRGLLDFNMLTGDWPDALPGAAGDFPRCGGS